MITATEYDTYGDLLLIHDALPSRLGIVICPAATTHDTDIIKVDLDCGNVERIDAGTTEGAPDTDIDGNLDPTTVTILTGPPRGTVTVNSTTGDISYTPNPNVNGTDTLSYEICDTDGLCDTATVTIPMTRPKVSSASVWVVMVKSSSPRWRDINTARAPSTTSDITSVPLATISISTSSSTSKRSIALATGT